MHFVGPRSPAWYPALRAWSLVSPGVMALILALVAEPVKRVWLESHVSKISGAGSCRPGRSPRTTPLVIDEWHHRTRSEEVRNPRWLVIPRNEEERITEDIAAMKKRLDERWAAPDMVDV